MTQRNFLRRQLVEYRELNGLRKGFRVSAIVNNEPEQGTVKWIGTIKGIMYVGIEFERAVGNQFPETNGAPLFAGSVSHSRLVFPEDVKTGLISGQGGGSIVITIMEHGNNRPVDVCTAEQKLGPQVHQLLPDEDNYSLEDESSSATPTFQYLCLNDNRNRTSLSSTGTTDNASVCSGRSSVTSSVSANKKRGHRAKMNQQQFHHHQPILHEHHRYYSNLELSTATEDDSSDFLSTTCSLSSSSSSASSYAMSSVSMSCSCGSGSVNGNSGELKAYDEKLSSFYKACSHIRRVIKENHAKFEELPYLSRYDEGITLSLGVDKLKNFKCEVQETLYECLEQCKMEMETVLRYSEIILPSEEKKIHREMREIKQSISNLNQEIGGEIDSLENFTAAYQTMQVLHQERCARFGAIKTRLVQVERNLVKDEGGLALRLKGIQSILSVLERDHDTSDNSEISQLLAEISANGFVDASRIVTQANDLILAERQLLEEVRTKRALLKEAKESYVTFVRRLSNFQSWYADFMKRLSETRVTGVDFDVQHPALVSEREEKKKEFIAILNSAKNLRASIFDSSAVDKKIEALQVQWKVLVDKVYRVRSRKTV